MAESLQHKLDRVRRPRVQITYDVETGGAMKKTELPFVVGIMADLSGQPKEALKPLKERPFVAIDRDNFNDVMGRMTPGLNIKVENTLTNDNSELALQLKFKSIDAVLALLTKAGVSPGQEVVTYCAVGMRASLMYWAARTAGIPARVYVGSMQDWQRDSANPVVR